MDRREYFNTVVEKVSPEDFHLQLAALIELCKHGKDLSGFRWEIIELLCKWVKVVFEAAEKARKSSKSSPKSQPLREERNFNELINFVINVIKFNLNVFDDDATAKLIDSIIHVASQAKVLNEMKACIRVLDAIVTYGTIPASRLKEFVLILCSVHFLVTEAKPDAWNTMSHLCTSHNGHATITILLDVLRGRDEREQGREPGKDTVRKIRGAMQVLDLIMAENGVDGFPLVPIGPLLDALSQALTLSSIDERMPQSVLKTLSILLGEKDQPLGERILDEDWEVIFDVAVRSIREACNQITVNPPTQPDQRLDSIASAADTENTRIPGFTSGTAEVLHKLLSRVEQVLMSESNDFVQRENCIEFLAEVAAQIPDSCARLVINHYIDYRYCYPSDADWERNSKLLLDSFFLDRSRPSDIRLQALKAVADVYEVVEVMDEYQASGSKRALLDGILQGLAEEKNIDVLRGIMTFAVSVCDNNDSVEFESIIHRLHDCLTTEQPAPDTFPTSPRPAASTLQSTTGTFRGNQTESTPATVITRAVIQIFMRAMDRSAAKAQRSFDEILWIARSNACDTEARLAAMKMLFRLRADWANRIFLTPFTEADALSATLYRTSASLARKQAMDDASQARLPRGEDSRGIRNSSLQSQTSASVRAMSGITRTLQLNHQLWMTPDPDALPEPPSNKASTILVSANTAQVAGPENVEEPPKPSVVTRETLKMNVWLETVIDILQQDCDWEVYSYMLAHLPSQLANHSLFKAATPQIQFLRSVLCGQIKTASFHNPPVSSGLRKADVAICLFQVLTMVMGYHNKFVRNEEDEIVRSFIHGLATWERSAKCCIHALSICCHELPASMKMVLGPLLMKMSQIITQSHVAVHILEFLAGLSRLPDLYGGFSEGDHRTVFGICFRYLQSVRDQNSKPVTSNRSSASTGVPSSEKQSSEYSGPNPAVPDKFDDLPQYVFSLAYHVITYWFLALRLTDRGSHVSWITKNLVWTDEIGKPCLDEQAEVTLDFMRRTAYADVDESRADEEFTPENHGDILKERWLVGQSIITVEQATKTGWAQITKRQPSATSHYMVRQKFDAPQAHQIVGPADGKRDLTRLNTNHFLPSNLPVQLLAPVSEASKPIHLPDNETIARAIRSMDRISTVDGHKVGIVYIGAGQTHEREILPNVSGSTDYVLFLSGLGTLTKLKGATFNTQGLDKEYDTDGEYTICWRDRVTELVFHVTTMMPTNLDRDPECIAKKRHIGNDFVNIIFNNSGNPFNFNTFPSEFNYVNIVITPESRASFMATRDRENLDPDASYYKVQVMSKEGFPEISPASETKILSLKALPEFIRLVALNASVFCLVWANRQGGEHVSSWRSRLREIGRLREKYRNPPPPPPQEMKSSASGAQGLGGLGGMGSVREEKETRNVRDSFSGLRRGSMANIHTIVGGGGGDAKDSKEKSREEEEKRVAGEREKMVEVLDFSRWA